MSSERPRFLYAVPLTLVLTFWLAACAPAPAPEITATPIEASATAPISTVISALETPVATDTAVTTDTPSATATSTTVPTEPLTATATPSATSTLTSTAAPTELLGTATATSTQVSPLTLTPGASPTPCFGSINGQVIADLNANHVADPSEPGVMNATLFLRNSSGIIGLYTTGNGQFSFPGLMAGNYNLSEALPPGYEAEGSISADLTVSCDSAFNQTFFNVIAGATPIPTFTPTPAPTVPVTPRPTIAPNTTPASPSAFAGSGFTPFSTGPVYYLGGCGTINAPGLYYLTTSLTSQWDCLQIVSNNVILDCQGQSLNGVDGNGYGVVVHHLGIVFGNAPRNIEIRRCNLAHHRYGIFVDAADNLYIHDNNSSQNWNDVDGRNYGIFLGLVEGGGIRVNDTRGALLSNNRTDGEAIGIDVRNSRGITVRGNSANGNSAWGVHFYGVTNSQVSSNVSMNNLRYCTWGSGVVGPGCDAGGIMLQAGSSYNTVVNNTINGNNGNGIFVKAHGTPCGNGNVIANNRIVGALYNAIELSFCRDNKIEGNEISNSLDGIWMGFATNNQVDAGNFLHDMTNHGIISWNSQDNNISSNRIVNSREGLYFYSSDYKKQDFWFVSGTAADHVSRGNCLCANQLTNNSSVAVHLANSIKNQMKKNTLTNNGTNFLFEGNTSGNVIQDNVIQGGSFDWLTPRGEAVAAKEGQVLALRVYDLDGNALSRRQLLLALATSSPDDAFDLRWFKLKLRASLGIIDNAPPSGLSNAVPLQPVQNAAHGLFDLLSSVLENRFD